MILQKKLKTERLFLRSLKSEDVGKRYLSWLQDEKINKYLESRHERQNLCQLRKYLKHCNRSREVILLGIYLLEDHQHIGNIKVGPIDWRHKRAEIGLFIGERRLHGKGLALEAIKKVAKFCSKELGLVKLTSGCYKSNIASQSLFLRAGFRSEGCRRNHWKLGKRWETGLIFGKILKRKVHDY